MLGAEKKTQSIRCFRVHINFRVAEPPVSALVDLRQFDVGTSSDSKTGCEYFSSRRRHRTNAVRFSVSFFFTARPPFDCPKNQGQPTLPRNQM